MADSIHLSQHRLQEDKVSHVAVTIVDILVSAPQNIGAKALIGKGGLLEGSIGGGKLEAKAIAFAQEMLERGVKEASLQQWNLKKDVGMTCGGGVSLFFEPFVHDQWPIYVFGAGHVAQSLIPLLLTLDCDLHCIDPRQEWLDKLPESPKLEKICRDDGAELISELASGSFIISVTQGHSFDLPILDEALHRSFPFVGVIGSLSKATVLKRELSRLGHGPEVLSRLKCPLGLELGGRNPPEIAISIAAQLLMERDVYWQRQPRRGSLSGKDRNRSLVKVREKRLNG